MRGLFAAVRLVVLLALVFATTAAGDVGDPPAPSNVLYGFINSNVTLTVAAPGPIYYVVGDLIVNSGATLTIEPGVTLRFASNRDTLGGGDYAGLTELRVRGHLVAQGTATDSIRLLSTDDGFGEWGQIKVDAGGDASLRHAVLKGALVGVRQASATPLFMADMLIRDCGYAAVIDAGTFTIRWLTVENCDNGIAVGGAAGTLQASRLSGRRAISGGTGLSLGAGVDTTPPDTGLVVPLVVSDFFYGVVLGGATVRNVVTVRNQYGIFSNPSGGVVDYCTSAANGIGFYMNGLLSNSIAANNVTGVQNNNCGALTVRFVDSWANTTNFQSVCVAMNLQNVESLNPFFVAPQVDNYRLSSGSVFESFSSTGGQIGAYGPHRGPNVVDVELEPAATSLRVVVSPNPSRGMTRFIASGATGTDAIVDIIDLTGRRVRRLGGIAGQADARSVLWDGHDERGVRATPGIYYWRFHSSIGLKTGRLVLIP